ncbi:MAG: YgiT-type zinc finger protein [Anaerolineae bacterium]|nr:YgiT-type zinc finger protein [Anaerolineae bacterium]MCB9132960.1 YgiT-type zinc finger protein [Anaerolineales bacterium]MCB0236683.1 YgiT-type zinc finger protein [Anaerolineae bacterium]MCB0240212.1 YgiT-type zinc finger protein [Anaerolineae bacterium]MCB0242681.1 YgiT-type zinc finger protein [Anaerolineae bacterium]
MKTTYPSETFVNKTVTYVLDDDGKIIVVENVPARVCVETGERLFSPETVERLQQVIWEHEKPVRILETPVYEFAG